MSATPNTTMNGTHPSSCFNPTAERIGLTFVYCVLFAVSLAGNTFIAIIVYKTKTMRKPTNFFIVNMAVSDLLFTIVAFPVEVKKLHITSLLPSGPLGLALCKLSIFLTFVSATVSIQSLVLIAVDRFGAVLFPLRSPLISSKHCLFFILATWIIALAFQCPKLFAWKLIEHRGELQCRWERSEATTSSRNYQLASTIVLFCVPFPLIIIIYVTILLKLKSRNIPGEQSVNAGQQRVIMERNVLKMSIAIVLAFAVCWLTLTVHAILRLLLPDSTMISSCAFAYFTLIAVTLAYSYCAINPCICFIFSGNYRQGLKNLLC